MSIDEHSLSAEIRLLEEDFGYDSNKRKLKKEQSDGSDSESGKKR